MSFGQFIHRLINEKSPFILNITNSSLLVNSLLKLDQLIGMEDAKATVMLQLEAMIANPLIFRNGEFLLNTIISGPPGVGKTELGKLLVSIWFSLGLVKAGAPVPSISTYSEHRAKLGTRMKKIQDRHRHLRGLLDFNYQPTSRELDKIILSNRSLRTAIAEWQHEFDNFNPVSIPTIPSMKVVHRQDFVAGYVGQTAIKTRKLLTAHLGQILFIDEAYSLINRLDDPFGMEALTELNSFMSEHPGEIIIIFAGYTDLMNATIFTAQPGLRSRFAWLFNLQNYTDEQLASIFTDQLSATGLNLSSDINLVEFFQTNRDYFPAFGRSTKNLALQCQLAYSSRKSRHPNLIPEINPEMLRDGLNLVKKNMVIEAKTPHLTHLYI